MLSSISSGIRNLTKPPITILTVCGFLLIAIAGCIDQKTILEKFAPKEDEEIARKFIDAVRTARYDEAKALLDAAVKVGPDDLARMHDIVDHGEPTKVGLVGANTAFFTRQTRSGKVTNLTYQIQFTETWVVATVRIESDAVKRRITSAHFTPIAASLETLHRFTLTGKSVGHYVVLAAVIFVPLFIVTTIVVCFRSRVRRPWLWAIFMVIGFGQLQFNWTTGNWAIRPISILLFGASTFREFYGPWILSVGLPVGALIFWFYRSRLRRTGEPPPLPPKINWHEFGPRDE